MPKLQFLNVDLDLQFVEEPKLFLQELGRKVVVLHSEQQSGGWFACLELNRTFPTAQKTIRHWLKVLDALSPKAKRQFLSSIQSTFNLGFDVDTDGHWSEIALPTELLGALAQWRSSYVITLYQAEAPPAVGSKTHPSKPRLSRNSTKPPA